ncbi:MAG: nicotinate (nicotinamide) nucleotide adenylyltransferase [Marinilabilia sp.]
MTQTGLLFGSFNPIHIGHLALANYMLEYVPFDEVWFIVSPQNPFKEENDLAPPHHRLEMTRLSITKESRFKVSDVEFNMPRPSYTIHTLRKLSREFPAHKFSMIIGSDNLTNIERWHSSGELLDNYPLTVYPRPGFPVSDLIEDLPGTIKTVKAPLFDISSTFIREGIKAGKQLRYMVPEGVFEYIIQYRLY